MPLSNIPPTAYKFHLMTLHVQQLFIYYFHSLFIYYLFCWLFTIIFTLLEGEEVMTGEDVRLLLERITGKLHIAIIIMTIV